MKPVFIVVSSLAIISLLSFTLYYMLTDLKFIAIFSVVGILMLVVLKILTVLKDLIA